MAWAWEKECEKGRGLCLPSPPSPMSTRKFTQERKEEEIIRHRLEKRNEDKEKQKKSKQCGKQEMKGQGWEMEKTGSSEKKKKQDRKEKVKQNSRKRKENKRMRIGKRKEWQRGERKGKEDIWELEREEWERKQERRGKNQRRQAEEFRGGSKGSEPISRPVEFSEKLTSIQTDSRLWGGGGGEASIKGRGELIFIRKRLPMAGTYWRHTQRLWMEKRQKQQEGEGGETSTGCALHYVNRYSLWLDSTECLIALPCAVYYFHLAQGCVVVFLLSAIPGVCPCIN